jgi:serine protease AprX
VTVAAGNLGNEVDAVGYPPTNDPFVMTVGAIDDMGTAEGSDDVPASWSSTGMTQDGFAKPELLAPGRHIVSTMGTDSVLSRLMPGNLVEPGYFRLSGTSMAAGVVSGVAALVLERHPTWSPGEVKCTLLATVQPLAGPYTGAAVPQAGRASDGADPTCNADIALAPSTGLGPMMKAGVIAYVAGAPSPTGAAATLGLSLSVIPTAALTGRLSLDSVDWARIDWNVVKWDAIKWNAVKWDAIKWNAIKWNAVDWSRVSSDGVDWTAIKWNAIKWSDVQWDAVKWSAIKWNAVEFDAIKWAAIKWSYLEGN